MRGGRHAGIHGGGRVGVAGQERVRVAAHLLGVRCAEQLRYGQAGGSRKKLAGDERGRFWHRLAGHLKIGTIAELKRRMSAREEADWIAYERINGPIGERRQDYHAAQIEAAVCNSQRVRGEPIQVRDCVLFGPKQPEKPQSLEDMMAAVKRAAPRRKRKGKHERRRKT